MPGVFCPRCRCGVILEQDGVTCSNCGTVIAGPPPTKRVMRDSPLVSAKAAPAVAPAPPKPRTRKPRPSRARAKPPAQ